MLGQSLAFYDLAGRIPDGRFFKGDEHEGANKKKCMWHNNNSPQISYKYNLGFAVN